MKRLPILVEGYRWINETFSYCFTVEELLDISILDAIKKIASIEQRNRGLQILQSLKQAWEQLTEGLQQFQICRRANGQEGGIQSCVTYRD
jgi:hypothetical protein